MTYNLQKKGLGPADEKATSLRDLCLEKKIKRLMLVFDIPPIKKSLGCVIDIQPTKKRFMFVIDIPLCHRKQAVPPKKLTGLRCRLARARTCNNAATRVLAWLSKDSGFIRTLTQHNHGTSRYVKSRRGEAANTTSRHGP